MCLKMDIGPRLLDIQYYSKQRRIKWENWELLDQPIRVGCCAGSKKVSLAVSVWGEILWDYEHSYPLES